MNRTGNSTARKDFEGLTESQWPYSMVHTVWTNTLWCGECRKRVYIRYHWLLAAKLETDPGCSKYKMARLSIARNWKDKAINIIWLIFEVKPDLIVLIMFLILFQTTRPNLKEHYRYNFNVITMLVRDDGDKIWWWLVWNVGDRCSHDWCESHW